MVSYNELEARNHNAQSKKTWRHSFSVGEPVPPKLLFEIRVCDDGMVTGFVSRELVVCKDALLSVVVQTPLLSSRDFDSVSLNVEPHSVKGTVKVKKSFILWNVLLITYLKLCYYFVIVVTFSFSFSLMQVVAQPTEQMFSNFGHLHTNKSYKCQTWIHNSYIHVIFKGKWRHF